MPVSKASLMNYGYWLNEYGDVWWGIALGNVAARKVDRSMYVMLCEFAKEVRSRMFRWEGFWD